MKQKKEKRIIPHELTTICTDILKAAGAPKMYREAVAHHLVEADLCGHESHGVAVRLPRYVTLLEKGALMPNTRPRIAISRPGMTVLDGRWGFGQVVGNRALEIGLRRAATRGAYSVAFRNSNHIGRLGYYGEIAARKGYLFFMVANVLPGNRQSHPKSPDAVIGTNPICFAFQWKDTLILVDTSTSAIAEGKVAVLRAKGLSAPGGMLRDHRGETSTDPAVLYESPLGSLWPLGGPESGYKGFALAVLVDMLAGLSSGGGLSGASVPVGANCGFMHIVDPAQFVTKKRIDEMMTVWMERMHRAKRLPNANVFILPGEPEMWNRAHNQAHGIVINDESWSELVALAHSYGVSIV